MEMRRRTRNTDSGNGHDAKLKSSTTLGFNFYFYIFCFTFLPLRLLASLVGTASANLVAETGRESAQSTPVVVTGSNSPHRRQLWRADISPARGQKDEKSKHELRRLIEHIRSVEFDPPKKAAEPVIVLDEAPTIEPDKAPAAMTVSKEEEKREVEPKLPYEPITAQTLQIIAGLSESPEKLDNPFDLGEILFLGGKLKEAAVFYQEVLKREDPDDTGSSQDRAWVLFQIGNCLRGIDLPAAAKTYGQLITEYPNSPWTEMATAQAKLIDWYLKDKPHELIAELENAGSD
jgi:tetratricopeptide (TPR) repeat protein